MSGTDLLTRDVFIAGGTPIVTYNPRAGEKLEDQLQQYLYQPGKAMCVAGPTKCGKTVLVKRILPETKAVWINGNDLTEVGVLWRKIVDYLNLYDQVEAQVQQGDQSSISGSGGIGVPLFSVSGGYSSGQSQNRQMTWTRQRAEQDVAREALTVLTLPIVIDDFHYVPADVKTGLARAIKSVIPTNPVLLIAVNPDAFEAVRAEPDLSGRVWQLAISEWREDELKEIAVAGFSALNLIDTGDQIGSILARESHHAPFLMQQLCLDVTSAAAIWKRAETPTVLRGPDDWEAFFARLADRTKPAMFEDLLRGPKVHGTPRTARDLKGGHTTDIYGAVLSAIARSTDPIKASVGELRAILDQIAERSIPNQDISNTLTHMSTIADEARGDSDPVLMYRRDEVHILDPFLSFYLRRSNWQAEYFEFQSQGG